MKKPNNFNKLQSKLSSTIDIKSEQYLYFGGTAYLGIPQNEAVINLFLEGITRFGLNNGTSRGNNVQLGIYDEAERFIAAKFEAEAAMVVSSGYLAAQLTVRALSGQGELRYAPNTHPALWISADPQNSMPFSTWSLNLVAEINSSDKDFWVLISNSINNLYPEIYDFSFLEEINPSKSVILILDDSHGIGILNGGKSILKSVPKLPNLETIVVASMAKALGVDAGVVFGEEKSILKLKQSNEFYGASPPAAAGLYAFIQSDEIYEDAYSRLMENVSVFKDVVKNNGNWHFVEGFPVFLSKEEGIDMKLQDAKILISSFPYPDKNGEILNRIVLSSWHSEADIEKLLLAIR
jgi:8-amino-7-oxononanoate synthase